MKRTARIISVLLAFIMMVGALTVMPAAASAATYRDNLIEAIINNESLWKPDYWSYSSYAGDIFFQDLNFDGVPEFIVRDFGGSMVNVSNRVFYYSAGKLIEATAGMESRATKGYPGSIQLYYNKTTGDMKYLGVWAARNGIQDSASANYTFSFNGKKVSIKHYAGSHIVRNMQAQIQSEVYYNGAKNYADFTGAKQISKSAYNSLINSYKKGFSEGNVTTVTISASDWKNYGTASRRSALRNSYDGYKNSVAKFTTPKVTSLSNTAAGVKITWGAVKNAEKYRVFGYTRNGWKKVGETASTSFVYKTANSGATYRFTVRCIDSAGNYTSLFNRSGFKQTYIGVPKLSGISKSSAGVTLKWTKPKGAAAFKIFRKTGNGSWKALGNTTASYYTDKTASSGVTYRYTVRCISKDGKKYVSAYDTNGLVIKR